MSRSNYTDKGKQKVQKGANPVSPFAIRCWGSFSLELSEWVPRHEKSMRCFSAIVPRMAQSPNQIWPPLPLMRIQLFSIYTFNTSFQTNYGVGNPFLILLGPFGVLLTLKGHGQGHFCYSEGLGHNFSIVRTKGSCNKSNVTNFAIYVSFLVQFNH